MRRSDRRICAARARGFTLIEAVASMVVLAIIGSSAVGLTWTAVSSYTQGAEALRLQSEASVAMERLARELRAMEPDEDGNPDIQAMTATSMRWGGGNVVSLAGDQLLLTLGGTESVLCEGVEAFEVRGFDGANNALGTTLGEAGADAVRRVQIDITLSSGEASSGLRSRVFLRCMALEALP